MVMHKRPPVFDKLGNLRPEYAAVSTVELVDALKKYMGKVAEFVGDAENLEDKLKLNADPRAYGILLSNGAKELEKDNINYYSVKVPSSTRKIYVIYNKEHDAQKLDELLDAAVNAEIKRAEDYRRKVYRRGLSPRAQKEQAGVEAISRFMNTYTMRTEKNVWAGSTAELWLAITQGTYRTNRPKHKPRYLRRITTAGALARLLNNNAVLDNLGIIHHIAIERYNIPNSGRRYWVIYWGLSATKAEINAERKLYWKSVMKEEMEDEFME